MKTQGISEDQLAILNESYPVSEDDSRPSLPRFSMLSKDITEESGTGKNKKIRVIQSSGTFFTESDKGEVNDEGKKVWTKEFIEGETVEVIIPFHRKQLRLYDASLEKFISTPIFDNSEQVVPLYLDKQVIKRGTQKELQALYPAMTQKGKPSSKLKEQVILYVIYKDILHQTILSVSSGFMFRNYKKTVNPSTVITTLGSIEETFGDNTYRKMTFINKRIIDTKEFEVVRENQVILQADVQSDSKLFLTSGEVTKADREFEEIGKKKETF